MQPLLNCSTEELVCLLSMCGHHEMARGLGESLLGEKSPEGWDTVMEGAAHQLMLKGLWDTSKAAKDDIPLTDELIAFVHDYADSAYMVRFVDRENGRSLLFHQLSDAYWLYHQVINDVIHIFGRIETKDTQGEVDAFFGFTSEGVVEQEFVLTPEQFDQLTEPEQVDQLRQDLAFLLNEEELLGFNEFVFGLSAHDWTLKNGSSFVITGTNEGMYMNDIFFFLPTPNGIWIVVYELENDQQQVKISKKSKKEWLELSQVFFQTSLTVS
ncbi:hypothetical protein [Shouchella patagoniensis]|uniref:hypothetical protein n=1 Tax=Shouchella patagoniensis TaxID=228576 RepID=UPI00099520A9|nr:hypothetical protein [Shouchella patagoniensis]